MKKIIHVITALEAPGGAEMMLYKLLKYRKSSEISPVVISMTHQSEFSKIFDGLGVKLYFLDIRKKRLKALWDFIKIIRKEKPCLIQGWMYHANFLAIATKLFYRKAKVLFNIRQSLSDVKNDKPLTRVVIYLNAYFSRFVTCVINNSKTSIGQHQSVGFSKKNSCYIANGFDAELFKPNAELYKQFRITYNLGASIKILGNLARFHPIKNHLGFLEICKKIREKYSEDVFFVLAGKDISGDNENLIEKIQELGLKSRVLLLGPVKSEKFMLILDLYVSSSWDEGFPNVLGEAMSCGVPCVATNVGDCKLIIDKYGRTAKPGDYDALAQACVKELTQKIYPPSEIRQHIVDNYSINRIVNEYESLYLKLME